MILKTLRVCTVDCHPHRTLKLDKALASKSTSILHREIINRCCRRVRRITSSTHSTRCKRIISGAATSHRSPTHILSCKLLLHDTSLSLAPSIKMLQHLTFWIRKSSAQERLRHKLSVPPLFLYRQPI